MSDVKSPFWQPFWDHARLMEAEHKAALPAVVPIEPAARPKRLPGIGDLLIFAIRALIERLRP